MFVGDAAVDRVYDRFQNYVDLPRLHHPLDRRYMLGMARSLEFARSAARSDGLLAMNRVHDFALIFEITRANQSRCGKTLLAIIIRRRRTERMKMEVERRIGVLGFTSPLAVLHELNSQQ